ncbi:TIGR03086 family metal-binding protein [Amycolatopsis sp. DG1A-15b]|uniref:TIGR03086 family metal-binding protein n=1 Tax=Amycolatopsis sp. DG1A-15b TaxID=3052846 RepID=UPI00255BCF4C|nr:TIGR03086 family metal-binding protein [Amycolatopsis sp. DG1A-15b]WIX86254.1 TIGR03086 family metal-binding protein [Amycolatopsis sp. DG1A-15b]
MTAELLRPAAAEFLRIACAVPDLTAPTPCAGYDVRGLLNHFLYWGPWLIAAGRREDPPAMGSAEADAALVTDGWRADLEKQTETLVEVFGTPAAWTGTTALGSAPMPSAVVGAMVLGEFVLHGWDLARASGQECAYAPEAATVVYESAVAMGDQARSMGVYGPAVAVAADASPLERALGAAGRDPGRPA